jgi:polysaccharide biosynthesis/export protein
MEMFIRKDALTHLPLGFLVAVLLLFSGCSGAHKLTSPVSQPSKVTLQPGDELDIKFFKTPELNETQVVRPDGRIVLQLIGEVDVRDLSPEELQDRLVKLYENQLKNPEISVIVRRFYSRRVYVGGEVRNPGFVEMPGQLTLLEAIMNQGGFVADSATTSKIMVIRQRKGEQQRFIIDVSQAFKNQQSTPFYLQPFDIVYVPQSGISRLNQWVDQHINRVVPQFGLVYTRPVGSGNVGINGRY